MSVKLPPFGRLLCVERRNCSSAITFSIGNRFDALRTWLNAYREEPPLPLDIFISRLFGEMLSQPASVFIKITMPPRQPPVWLNQPANSGW
jgi:hypothetical protein